MNERLKKRWIEALRSGRFKQTIGALRDENGYCCLGVLHLVATGKRPYSLWSNDKPKCVVAFGEKFEECLASMNDDGVPFDIIAGFINEAL